MSANRDELSLEQQFQEFMLIRNPQPSPNHNHPSSTSEKPSPPMSSPEAPQDLKVTNDDAGAAMISISSTVSPSTISKSNPTAEPIVLTTTLTLVGDSPIVLRTTGTFLDPIQQMSLRNTYTLYSTMDGSRIYKKPQSKPDIYPNIQGEELLTLMPGEPCTKVVKIGNHYNEKGGVSGQLLGMDLGRLEDSVYTVQADDCVCWWMFGTEEQVCKDKRNGKLILSHNDWPKYSRLPTVANDEAQLVILP